MSKIYISSLEVRGYELDSFGHVNHAQYVSYMEHARWKMLQEKGITLEKLNEWKRWPVIAQLEVSYLKPTYIGEELRIETQVTGHERTNFMIEQNIFRGDQKVLIGKVRVVMVDEKGRPALMPDHIANLWTEE